ncbi:biotin transporter BioY [Vallitalea longa]|uniref:Biotin transporter n=1 Tax=Vallitalea longa TaxID=2936439 RepID=A0A9W5Y897_9FIRM|nr:biotin transporter BioY [Vallitalea longa]GKX27770.1 biotin transporter BioY [Vallitalea longa]
MNTKELILAALFAAITGILSIFQIPLPTPVPFTLQVLAVTVSGVILGSKIGALSQLTYVLLGLVGIPIFAGGSAGVGVLVGPTGGFLIGFIISSFVIGKITEKTLPLIHNGSSRYITILFAMIFGLIIIHCCGVIQFSVQQNVSLGQAFGVASAPFIIFDLIKVVFGSIVAYFARDGLVKANLLQVQV